MTDLSFGKLIGRSLLYVGIALVVLVVFAVAVVLSKGQKISGNWFALAVYTVALFWIAIRQSRRYWQHLSFWLSVTGLLIVHLFAFVAILRVYPQWRMIWFWPIVVAEGGLFGAIFYLLFGKHKRQ